MKKKVKKNKNRRVRYCNKKSPKIKFSFIIDSDIKYSRANKRVISNENLKEYLYLLSFDIKLITID